MTAFGVHFAFEFKTGLRNRNQLFINYIFPLGVFFLLAFMMPQLNPAFKETLLPAMVIFAVLSSNILGLPTPIIEAREAGVYRSYKINGVPAASILSIPVITNIFHSLIVAAIITVTGILLFDGLAPTNWPIYVFLTVLFAFTCASLGALIGVIATSSTQSVLFSQLIFLPSMLIGGLMIPLSMLPAAIQPFSALLPTTHGMIAYTGLAYGVGTAINPWLSTVLLLISGLLAFGLAIYLFNWDNRNQARRGSPLLALLAMAPYLVGVFLIW